MSAVEANLDGLVGPTHNYAGLSRGNLASERHGGSVARPRLAVLQSLAKMKRLADLGLIQGVLPPQERPAIWRLRELGFAGTDAAVLEKAWSQAPQLVARASSASSMWAANAATVCPSADTADGRIHFTPANLLTMPHRALESGDTSGALQAAFPDPDHFVVHAPLPAHSEFADEGAANHLRLCRSYGQPGVEVFVYGRSLRGPAEGAKFPARQTLESCQAIARRAGLDPQRTVFARQSPVAIKAGAFHNDVVAVSDGKALFFHEAAFAEPQAVIAAIRRAAVGGVEPAFIKVSEAEVPLGDAVRSYLFNSQLLSVPEQQGQLLFAPQEVAETPSARAYCEMLTTASGPITRVEYTDLRQSMQNGGGPACLRLRVVLTEAQLAAAKPALFLDGPLYDRLVTWATSHYREELAPQDLGDLALLRESRGALDELTQILELGERYYAFQRG